MKIDKSSESGDIQIETSVFSRNVKTHSRMTDLTQEQRMRIQDLIRMLNAEIILMLHKISAKAG